MPTQRREILALLDEFKRLEIGEQIDYQKSHLYSIITHSTAIEGSTVTEIENRLLFDEGITASGRSMMEQFKKGSQQDVHVNVHVNLSARQQEILNLLQENPSVTLVELASQLNVNEKTIRRDLTLLRQQGIVLRQGSDKKGLWHVVTE